MDCDPRRWLVAVGVGAGLLVLGLRELMKRGELLAAKDRFEAAFDSTGDAEALFLAAECWEKAGDDEAAKARSRSGSRKRLDGWSSASRQAQPWPFGVADPATEAGRTEWAKWPRDLTPARTTRSRSRRS
jgi:hypothetical protein